MIEFKNVTKKYRETGVTAMKMDEGMDTGDILKTAKTEIGDEETAEELFDRLSGLTAELLVNTLSDLEKGNITPKKQDEEKASYAPIIKKEMAQLDFVNKTATEIHNAVRGYYIRRHGYEVKREWHTVTGGIVPALSLAVKTFARPDEGVIIQSPVYTPFFRAIEMNGRKVAENRLILKDGRYEMDLENLEKLCARDDIHLMILCSPHNPVGRVWREEELWAVGRICKKHGVFVLADEIHCDILLNGAKHHSFLTFDEFLDNCMVCTAMSKTFNVAGLLCSDIFIPNRERYDSFMLEKMRSMADTVPYFARAASIAAHNDCDEWIDEMINAIEANFNTFYGFIGARLPMLKCIRAEGTYLAWLDMRALGLNDEEQKKMHVDAYLDLDEGYIFGANGSGFARWNLALPESELIKALERLENAIKPILKKRGLI